MKRLVRWAVLVKCVVGVGALEAQAPATVFHLGSYIGTPTPSGFTLVTGSGLGTNNIVFAAGPTYFPTTAGAITWTLGTTIGSGRSYSIRGDSTSNGIILNLNGTDQPAITAPLGQLLFANAAAANPTGTTPTFDTTIVAANRLNVANATLVVRASGHVANNGNAKSVKIQVAGTTVDSFGITATTANTWSVDCTIQTRTTAGSGTQVVWCTHWQGSGTPTQGVGLLATLTFDPTVANVIAIRGVQTTQNDVIQDGFSGLFFP